ncbi:MAG: Crp/Fnr family transcriptional regulator [Saprospiraceae bacterium]|nr:Crp/Fnr family transcriptional regulator [Saprospiraceae bacterium]
MRLHSVIYVPVYNEPASQTENVYLSVMTSIERLFTPHLALRDARALTAILVPELHRTRSYFAEEGRRSDRIGFIKRGLARSFYITTHGEEMTICFAGAGSTVFDPVSFFSGDVARFSIQFLQDSEVFVTTRSQLKELYATNARINTFARERIEASYVFMMKRIIGHQTETAEQRYRDLMDSYPDLFLQIPQKHIASYLGITESSLSRIRRKMTP